MTRASILCEQKSLRRWMDCTATRACPSCAVLCAASRENPTCAVKPGNDGWVALVYSARTSVEPRGPAGIGGKPGSTRPGGGPLPPPRGSAEHTAEIQHQVKTAC